MTPFAHIFTQQVLTAQVCPANLSSGQDSKETVVFRSIRFLRFVGLSAEITTRSSYSFFPVLMSNLETWLFALAYTVTGGENR